MPRATMPLAGRRIVVTRPKKQAAPFVSLLEAQGAEAVCFTTIVIHPPKNMGPLDTALDRISSYKWCIFTSARGVEAVAKRLAERAQSPEALAGLKLAAIGPKTAKALEDLGLTVDCMPNEYRAEAIIAAIGPTNFSGSRILLPRARFAREVLPESIRALGGIIDVVEAYRTEAPPSAPAAELARRLAASEIDAVTFTSSSTVTNFLALLADHGAKALLDNVSVACIGPITAETARRAGLAPAVVAESYTAEGLVEALITHFATAQGSF